MTFLALLIKEMRLYLRRERTIWVVVVYLCCMGLVGWVTVKNSNMYDAYSTNALNAIGLNLYCLLSLLQLFLVVFMTPAFTATAVNSEKERQTYDLLRCSQLSPLALVGAKTVAGLANALLMVAASIPFFSLVFFFGGVNPDVVIGAIAIYITTIMVVGSFSLFCSTMITRPAISTVTAYLCSFAWIGLPLIATYMLFAIGDTDWLRTYPAGLRLLYAWNPVSALFSTYPNNSDLLPFYYGVGNAYGGSGSGFSLGPMGLAFSYGNTMPYEWGGLSVAPWMLYSIFSVLIALVLFGSSILVVRGTSLYGLVREQRQKRARKAA